MPKKFVQYESPDYGIFTICEDTPNKYYILWDPEECCEDMIMDEELDNDRFSFCSANPLNLTIKNFLDIPSDGMFNTFQEAYDYVVSKFGKIN